ncbi:hypothetical protein H2203_008726 [Taxawa tesnikishii (nom. ined.)]|nr:hypothetical protein H2203_008726 [Dothideales sp. JES 119]
MAYMPTNGVPHVRSGETVIAGGAGRKCRKLTFLQTMPLLETAEPRPSTGTSYGFRGYESAFSERLTADWPETRSENFQQDHEALQAQRRASLPALGQLETTAMSPCHRPDAMFSMNPTSTLESANTPLETGG